jgi:hypothetical protein
MLSRTADYCNPASLSPLSHAGSPEPTLHYFNTADGQFKIINLRTIVSIEEDIDGQPILTLVTGEKVSLKERNVSRLIHLLVDLGYMSRFDLPQWMQEDIDCYEAVKRIAQP